ncbi:MAG: tetratricopeptide repeat protein [Endomicrobiales bacterium]
MKNKIIICLIIMAMGIGDLSAMNSEAYYLYARGLLAAKAGDLSVALENYKQVVTIDSKALAVYKDLITTYWQLGESTAAFKSAEKLKEMGANDVDTQLFLGNFYLLTGQSNKARESWEKTLKIDPNNEAAILYLAAYHSSSDSPEKAIDYWNRYIIQKPESAEGYYQLGLIQQKIGQLDNAADSFRKTISLKPESPEAYLELAQLLEKENKLPEAVIEFNKYLVLVPDNVTVVMYLGGLLYRMKEFSTAQDMFVRAKKMNPTDTTIDFWLGILAEEHQDWPAAIRYFEAVRKKDSTPMILVRLSYYYSSLKNYKKAVRYLQQVSRQEPKNPNLYYLLGLAYMDMNKYKQADENFLKALERRPDSVEAHFHRGVMFDQWGKFDKAVPELEKAFALDPQYAPSLNYLGYSYVDRGVHLDEAEPLIKRALIVEPDNGSYRDSLGWLYFKQGKYSDAERELSQAVTQFPDPVVFEHLGDVLIKLNKTTDAWEAYRAALDRAPDNNQVRKKLKALEKLVLPGTIQRKLLKRAEDNLKQIRSMNATVLVSAASQDFNFRSFGRFKYLRPSSWRVDILGSFLAPQFAVIATPDILVYPAAISQNVTPEQLRLLGSVMDWFNGALIDRFDSDKTIISSHGNKIYYRLDTAVMVLDKRDGILEECTSPDYQVTFKDYHSQDGVAVPCRIQAGWKSHHVSAEITFKSLIINEPVEPSEFQWTGQTP